MGRFGDAVVARGGRRPLALAGHRGRRPPGAGARRAGVRDPCPGAWWRRRAACVVGRRCRWLHRDRGAQPTPRSRWRARSPGPTCSRAGRRPTSRSRASPSMPPPRSCCQWGHRASVTVGLAHDGRAQGPLPSGLPTADATARGGWRWPSGPGASCCPTSAAASCSSPPAATCSLAGPSPAQDDPVGFLLGLAELCPHRRARRRRHLAAAYPTWPTWSTHDATVPAGASTPPLDARRCSCSPRPASAGPCADVARITGQRSPAPVPLPDDVEGIRVVPVVERRLAVGPVLLARRGSPTPGGAPTSRPTACPSVRRRACPYAVRWHGEHPAVLWEVTGDPVELSAPALDPTWRTAAASGDALWRADCPR